VAFVVPGARRPTGAELQAFLLERLAKYKLPRDFVFVEALPRTAYGKVVKGELRERWLAAQGMEPQRHRDHRGRSSDGCRSRRADAFGSRGWGSPCSCSTAGS